VEAGGQREGNAMRRKPKSAVGPVNQNKGIASMSTITMVKNSATANAGRRKIKLGQ